MSIQAKIIQSSVSPTGTRLDTFEIEIPRIILAELNTHRALSRNFESSRAVSFTIAEKKIMENMFIPKFTPAQAGMQGYGEHDVLLEEQGSFRGYTPEEYWRSAGHEALTMASQYHYKGYHKQVWNRLLEPFTYVKGIVSATDWDNFFNLRIHHMAEPHIRELAIKMYKARRDAKTQDVPGGAWHIPYIDYLSDTCYYNTIDGSTYSSSATAIKVGISLCAQVSYRTQDSSVERAELIYKKLFPKNEPVHCSPAENVAMPGNGTGNFKGWKQYRHMIANNTCYEFTEELFEKRLKEIETKNGWL